MGRRYFQFANWLFSNNWQHIGNWSQERHYFIAIQLPNYFLDRDNPLIFNVGKKRDMLFLSKIYWQLLKFFCVCFAAVENGLHLHRTFSVKCYFSYDVKMSPPCHFSWRSTFIDLYDNRHVEYFNIKSPHLRHLNRKRALKLSCKVYEIDSFFFVFVYEQILPVWMLKAPPLISSDLHLLVL